MKEKELNLPRFTQKMSINFEDPIVSERAKNAQADKAYLEKNDNMLTDIEDKPVAGLSVDEDFIKKGIVQVDYKAAEFELESQPAGTGIDYTERSKLTVSDVQLIADRAYREDKEIISIASNRVRSNFEDSK